MRPSSGNHFSVMKLWACSDKTEKKRLKGYCHPEVNFMKDKKNNKKKTPVYVFDFVKCLKFVTDTI